ncbi:MAG: HD domain-containing protein [Balneolaceae bacterium]
MTLQHLEKACEEFISTQPSTDSAHGLPHVRRVVKNVRLLLQEEEGSEFIAVLAAWLHDCVSYPKNHPHRKLASKHAAAQADAFLATLQVPRAKRSQIAHAIEAHSFSANIEPKTIDAAIVQDADRMEALGAIGIARCLMVGAELGRPLCHPTDPFCEHRDADDSRWTIDHFYAKLFALPDTMRTEAGKREAEKRVQVMNDFLARLAEEL